MLSEGGHIATITIVVQQTQNPIEGITFDTVRIRGGTIEIGFHKVAVSKSNHRGSLGRMGIAGP